MHRNNIVALLAVAAVAIAVARGASVGGDVSPDGVKAHCPLPGDLHRKNTSSKGLGNCVFTSIHHSALWQNVDPLVEFPQWLIDKGIAGGGWPEKVAALIPKISSDRGMEAPQFLQVQDSDLEVLKAACQSGRMPGVTYAFDPSRKRYGGQNIAHMVSLVHADDKWFCILDNNYIGEKQFQWMTPEEFRQTYTGGGRSGWSVILLSPGPPPKPRN